MTKEDEDAIREIELRFNEDDFFGRRTSRDFPGPIFPHRKIGRNFLPRDLR